MPCVAGMTYTLSNLEYPQQKQSDFEGGVYDLLSRVVVGLTPELAHQSSISFGLQAAAPHIASKEKEIAEQQEEYPLYNGRPAKNSAFDVRLFHPVLDRKSVV